MTISKYRGWFLLPLFAAHLSVMAAVGWWREGFAPAAELPITLATVVPPALLHLAGWLWGLFLPTVVRARPRDEIRVPWGLAVGAMLACVLLAAGAVTAIGGFAYKEWCSEIDSLIVTLALVETAWSLGVFWHLSHLRLLEQNRRMWPSRREALAGRPSLEDRLARGRFDVFVSYNSDDREDALEIAEGLIARGLLPWLDVWELRPGLRWQPLLERQIQQVRAAAVLVGASGVGPWQAEEVDAFLRVFADRGDPVIPVLLESAPQQPDLPLFLAGRTWIDLREPEPDPMERLVFGISGAGKR